MSLIGNIGCFVEGEEDFSTYCTRVELFFAANKVKDDIKVPCFLSLIGPKVFKLVSDLVSPKSPGSCTYDELEKALSDHFKPQVVLIYERFQFHKRNQKEGESVSDFSAALKSLARTCDFGSNLEDQLRDRFVVGLRDEASQRTLLTVKKLTFAYALDTALAREAAAIDVEAIRPTNGPRLSNTNKIQSQNKYKKSNFQKKTGINSKANTNLPKTNCFGCGEKHWKSDCPFKEAVCHSCQKKGHIKKMCYVKGKNSNSKNTNSNVNSSHSNPIQPNSEYIFYNESVEPFSVNL